jgi:hypothetical protein
MIGSMLCIVLLIWQITLQRKHVQTSIRISQAKKLKWRTTQWKEDVSSHCKMDKGISQLPNYDEIIYKICTNNSW